MRRATFLVLVVLAGCGDGEDSPICLVCLSDASHLVECGPGTVEDEHGVCLTKHHFEIRIAENELGANGHTRRRVVAFGTNPDGTPVTAKVVLGLDRASAGTIDFPFQTLDTHGAHALFTPCDAAATDCLGPATLTLALADAPSQILAQTSINLVPATNVSSVAPCIDHPQKFHLDVNVKRPPAIFEVDEGSWAAFDQLSNRLGLEFLPVPAANFDSRTNLNFETTQMLVPMTPGIYEDARTSSSQTPDKPAFDFTFLSSSCPISIFTRFQIHAYTRDTATSDLEFLASWEQLCDGTSYAEGCVRFEP
jgi:hypothetical protein